MSWHLGKHGGIQISNVKLYVGFMFWKSEKACLSVMKKLCTDVSIFVMYFHIFLLLFLFFLMKIYTEKHFEQSCNIT